MENALFAEDVYVQFMKKHFPDVFTARKKAPQADIGVRGKHKDNFFLPSVGNDYDGEIEDFLQNSDDECDERDIPLTDKTSKWFQQKLLFPRTTQLVIEDSFGGLVRRLREPWDLYGLTTKRTGQLACWPQECEVIKERIRHIEGVSLGPEPLYVATGLEQAPIYTGPEEGEVVYVANKAYLVPYFTFSRVSGSRKPLKQAAINLDKQGNTLIFEARFESGNLQKVFKVGKHEYNLILRTDLYTAKHTQWYYFRVQNTEGAIPYRFTIINLMKPTSLYNMGMKPLMYSTKDAEWYKLGWRRVGSQIKYYPNNYGDEEHRYYSLTWTFEFPHNADTCYFAHCYPYTYSDLQDYLIDVANDPVRSTYCKVRVLCRSLAGNMVYILTVTNPSETPKAAAAKKAVVLTARVHPGETNSSWMMKGFLDCLLGNSMDAKLLRDTFLFKIVPMLNPDGVIVGNYRCSLTGQDLNRKYRSFLKDHYAPVWYTRKLIKRLFEERDVFLYCDLHGHSRKQNIFMYGCQSMHTVSSCAKQRVLPLMLSKNCCNKFSLRSCKFHVQRAKEGTGRVVAWRMGIANSYTLEATFCGSTLGNKKNIHFSVNDLVSVGFQFCDTLLDYCDPDQSKYIQCTKQLRNQIKKDIAAKMETPDAGYDSDASFSDILSYIESSTTGSNSSESDDPPLHFVTKEMPKRKTQLKTKKQRQNSYLIRKVLNTAKHYQQPQAPNKPEQTHGEKPQGWPVQVPYQNDSEQDPGANVVRQLAAVSFRVEGTMIAALPQPHDTLEEHENEYEHEQEQPTTACKPGPQVTPWRNTTMHERKASTVSATLSTEDSIAISEAQHGAAEDSVSEEHASGGQSIRLHHATNKLEWVPKNQPVSLEAAHLKPQSFVSPARFFPVRKTKLPIIDHMQNRDLRAARRETFYKVLAVPPSLLTAGNVSSEMPSSTTDSQSVLDSARVEQTHAHDADPNHQEEVCSDECLLVVSPDLASSRLGIRDRSHQPYSGKQVFSEERVDTLDSANTRLRIIKERMKSRPGSDQMTAFTQMWQGTHSHNCQSGSKQPMRVVSRTLSAKSTRFNLPTTKRGAELKASNESLTENRISSAASKSALCNCLDFSDSACGHEEEATRMGESVLPHHQHWITGLTDKQQGLSSYSLQTGNDGQQQRQSLKTGPEENPYKFHVKTESSLGLKKGLRIKAAGSPLPQDTRIRNDSVEQGHGETSTLSGIYTEKVAESPTSNSLKSLKKELGTFSQVYSNHFSCLDRQGRDLTTSISNNSLLTDISVEPHCSSLIRERGPV